jgi:2-dehydropantoate 2-reductase
MRIGIIGAGAMGGSIAALLSRQGHEIQLVARGTHLEAIRADGLRLTGQSGEFVAEVHAAAELASGAELVIVAVKAQDAHSALLQHRHAIAGQPVLVVQNGIDGVRDAAELLPDSPIIGGLATSATSYLSPGLIDVTAAGAMFVGVLDGSTAPAHAVASILNPVIPTTVTENFHGAQWTKLVINQVNALPAITGLSVQEVVEHGGLRRIIAASIRETARVGLAAGVRFEPIQSLTPTIIRMMSVAPLWLGAQLPRLLGARAGDVPNPGSTLQSIQRGQPTEIDYLNGAVVREAERLGRTAPVSVTLVELVHEVERSGRFLSVPEVTARLHV